VEGYGAGHRRMRPLLNVARIYDISINSHLHAVFDPGHAAFAIWCTLRNYPKDDVWRGLVERSVVGPSITFRPGPYAQGCEYHTEVTWAWRGESLAGIQYRTLPHVLIDEKLVPRKEVMNRPADTAWSLEQIQWLWKKAYKGEPLPEIFLVTNFEGDV
jgi:hypothetical protein